MSRNILLLSFFIAIQNAVALSPNSWQKRLDRAFLDVDGARNPQARFRLIQRALKDPELSKDLTKGINAVREKGMAKGHPELIDAFWPEGTLAREDIVGIQSLVKSLPERVEEVRGGDSEQQQSPSIRDVIQNCDIDVFQNTVRESFNTEENRKRSFVLAQNAFRRTPKSANLLPFADIDTIHSNDATVKIRSIEESSFYSTKMDYDEYTFANMGNTLIKLTNFILKEMNYNVGDIASPFIIRDSRMYIWKKDGTSIPPSSPSEFMSDTTESSIESWSACNLASIEFSGICTEGEVDRQSNKLKEALSDEGVMSPWKIVDDSLLVLQYNAPGTLPWRRKNQVAYVVEKVDAASVSKESMDAKEDDGDIACDDSEGIADAITDESTYE